MSAQQDIDVASYWRAQALGMESLSNDHIRAFSPATFTFHGYPSSAENNRAILRFVDTMQELNDPIRHHESEIYTSAEASLVERINSLVLEHTRREFGRSVRPWTGPLATLKMFRAIQAIASALDKANLRVFEIGPGSCYLGALLLAQGHQYWASDIAQGFYLWQSRLMRLASEGDFVEGALHDDWPYAGQARAVHVPWWHFATMYRSAPPTVDVVICDHALGEMNPYALRYVCQMSRLMLAGADRGVAMFSSVGEPRFNSDISVIANFHRVGLQLAATNLCDSVPRTGLAMRVINRIRREIRARRRAPLPSPDINPKYPIAIFSAEQIPAAIIALTKDIPLFNPDQSPQRLRGRDFVPIRWEEAPPSYELYRFVGFDTPNVTSSVTRTSQ